MNDPIMDGLNENLPRLTGEFLNNLEQLKNEAATRQQVLTDQTDQGQGGQTSSTSTDSSTEQQQQLNVPEEGGSALGPTRKETQQQLQEKVKSGEKVTFADTFSKQSADIRNPLNWANYASAMGAGITDFAIDTVNILPHVAIPKLPKYESGVLQGVREISGIVIPSLYGCLLYTSPSPRD